MLELIALFSLGKTIRNVALYKGLRPTPYILAMIAYWVSMELLGASVGLSFFGNIMGGYFCALVGAAFGGYLGYQRVLKAKDQYEG